MGNFIVTVAKEYDVPTMCNLEEFQMNLDELKRIIVISIGNLGELQSIMGVKVFVMAAKDYG